jgi:hypothetical protein
MINLRIGFLHLNTKEETEISKLDYWYRFFLCVWDPENNEIQVRVREGYFFINNISCQ